MNKKKLEITATEKKKLNQVLDRNGWTLAQYLSFLLKQDLRTVELMQRYDV